MKDTEDGDNGEGESHTHITSSASLSSSSSTIPSSSSSVPTASMYPTLAKRLQAMHQKSQITTKPEYLKLLDDHAREVDQKKPKSTPRKKRATNASPSEQPMSSCTSTSKDKEPLDVDVEQVVEPPLRSKKRRMSRCTSDPCANDEKIAWMMSTGVSGDSD